jgi:hypothetical protein
VERALEITGVRGILAVSPVRGMLAALVAVRGMLAAAVAVRGMLTAVAVREMLATAIFKSAVVWAMSEPTNI